ncbi:MAG: FUSC family membrane protein, partial [Pricia sp.]
MSAKKLWQFLKSTNFSKSILIGIAVTVPIVLGIWSGYFEIGLALCFGAFWSSPSDVNGSYRHKKYGILFSALLAMIVSFIGGYLNFSALLLVPVLGILVFAISFLAIYGFRASLISFSGLLALVLSFAHTVETLEIYQYALLVGLGGIWYLLLSSFWYRLNPKAQTEELLSDTFSLTAKYLETRGELVGPNADRKKLQSRLLTLQSELTETHQTLREILIESRTRSGKSNYQGKRLLVFVELIEILETAMANPVPYERMDDLLREHPEYIESFQDLILEIARQLSIIAEVGGDVDKYPSNEKLTACFEKVGSHIGTFNENNPDTDYREYLILQNLYEYQEKQFEKLKRIKWLLGDPKIETIDFIDKAVSKRFIVDQDYDPKLLLRSLSFKSTIFKHALRLAVTVMVGYALGVLLDFQNPYWILLTIIVIMRPSYGLTKTRAKDRIIGTLIGGAIASVLVFLIEDPYVYGGLGIASLVIAFSMLQKNYKASATFITLSVVFIYAIIRPDVLTVIQFRILDTLIGAALSFLALRYLWPAWSFLEISTTI